MKIVHFIYNQNPTWGALTEPTRITPFVPQLSFQEILSAIDHLEDLWADSVPNSIDVAHIRWLPPADVCSKVICIGRNYADHAKELGGEPPELPIVFSKFSSSLIGHKEAISIPSLSNQVDFEAELVVVIGKTAKNVSKGDALSTVAGYCCGNDISARDWQKGRPGGQWLLGKSFDTFGPLGPYLTTRDEIANPNCLDISLRLNGLQMQQASTQLLIYPIEILIEHVSKFFTLQPGDLIFTGTPAGVGAGRNPPVFLKPGDTLEVEVSGLGRLINSVKAAE